VTLLARADVVPLPARRSARRAALVSLRPRQWVKNLLLFAALVFAAKLGDLDRWLAAVAAFLAYCAASSAAYLVNDVRDVDADRRHAAKRRRPVARGELSAASAVALAWALAASALFLAGVLGAASVVVLVSFLLLQGLYTVGLRNVVLVDVMAIAMLFVIRAAAGAVAIDVRISPWLLVCTGLLALLLALGKRRAEVVSAGQHAPTRPALAGYPLAVTDQLLTVVAAATIGAYAVYTLTAHDTRALPATIPFVVYGVLRYLLLVHRRQAGEDPENILLGDLPTLVTVAAWVATCSALFVLSA